MPLSIGSGWVMMFLTFAHCIVTTYHDPTLHAIYLLKMEKKNIICTQFLMLKGPDDGENKVESMEHCEKFWYWLQDKGISAHRSAIVKAIALKVNGLLPGVYDPDLYEDDEDSE